MIDPSDDYAKRPLQDHLTDYLRLLANKGNTPVYIEITEARIRAVLSGCSFVRICDVQPSNVLISFRS